MSIDDSIRRLSAGLDRDEQLARTGAALWHADVVLGVDVEGVVGSAAYDHLTSHAPTRVILRELPLKCLILRDHRPQEKDDGTYCIECSTSLSLNIDEVRWPCEYIRALAGIYEPAEGGTSA